MTPIEPGVEFLRRLSEHLPVIAGRGASVTFANDAFLDIVGYDRAAFEASGLDWAAVTPSEWAPVDAAAMARMRRDGVSGVFRKEYFHRDGSRVPVIAFAVQIAEEPWEWVAGILERGDETVHGEAELRQILDGLLDDVMVCRAERNAEGRIVDFTVTYANAMVDGAGRHGTELIGRTLLELYPGLSGGELWACYIDVVESGRPYALERNLYEDTADDGTPIRGWWSFAATRFHDGILLVSRDVTELVELEERERAGRDAAERERVVVDLLQQAALPRSLPRVDGVELAAIYRPASTQAPVGGDWYDVIRIDDRHLGLVIADVAGHGAEAASFMVQVRNVLRTLAVMHEQPGDVLDRANEVIYSLDGNEGALFVTCLYAVLDLDELSLCYASAGHPPLVVITVSGGDSDDCLVGWATGPPLGIGPRVGCETEKMDLAAGDRLVLYTDGLVERRDEALDDSLDALQRRLRALRGEDAGTLAVSLTEEMANPDDDVAVLVVDVVGPAVPAESVVAAAAAQPS